MEQTRFREKTSLENMFWGRRILEHNCFWKNGFGNTDSGKTVLGKIGFGRAIVDESSVLGQPVLGTIGFGRTVFGKKKICLGKHKLVLGKPILETNLF